MNKRKLTISVVMLTNDRPYLLEKALLSLKRQTVKADEVIIVDDSSLLREETASVVKQYVDNLPIIKRNTRHSISYGRMAGAQTAKCDLVVYLDDDCRASPTYLHHIRQHFLENPRLATVFGRIYNALPDNPYASAQYAYYDHGLRKYFPDLVKTHRVTWGRILDCEVMGIKRSTLLTFGFPDRHLRYRNDDVELGLRLVASGQQVYFDPHVIAWASPRTSLIPLWTAAFWNGFSDAYTEKTYAVNLRAAPIRRARIRWFIHEVRSKKSYQPAKKIWYGVLLISFPIVTRIGKLWYYLSHIL